MRLVFAGTPAVAVPTLDALIEAGHVVVAVVTRPDAPLGRKRILTPSPVAQRAEELGLPVLRADRLGEEETAAIAGYAPDLGVVVAYGALLRAPQLAVPRHGWINLHFSRLPEWRGAAPVQRAVLAGQRTTGISVFQLEEGLDTGPVHVARTVDIGAEETSGELLDRLAVEAAPDVLAAIEAIERGETPTPQVGEPTHAAKLDAADGTIDWRDRAVRVAARIRGATPEPGAATQLDGQRFKVHRARVSDAASVGVPGTIRVDAGRVIVDTGDGTIELVTVQPHGKRPMNAADWMRGAHLAPEARFA